MRQYLDLMERILAEGVTKRDRTGTGTLSVFGHQMRFDLDAGFPLLTTRKLHLKSIIHELLWFLAGDTNIKYLKEHGVSIWDEWATDTGELGPVYGAQWRAWKDHDGNSIDQVALLMTRLRARPDSRRHIISAWNVAYLPDEARSPQLNALEGRMALAPCHVMYQFYVAGGRLSCMMTQRSCDVFLGLPYNVASTAFLTSMIAQQSELEPGEVVYSIGDTHLYLNHLDQARQQLAREPRATPRLAFRRRPASIFDYAFEDFEITGYDPHPHIAAPIAK